MKIQPHFDIDFARGRIGEELTETFLADLADKTIEVKTDYRINETGNIYVETWQYSLPDASDKRQSGINISKADYWCFASPTAEGFFMVKAEALKRFIRDNNPREVRQPISSEHTNASIGRLIPVKDLLASIGLSREG